MQNHAGDGRVVGRENTVADCFHSGLCLSVGYPHVGPVLENIAGNGCTHNLDKNVIDGVGAAGQLDIGDLVIYRIVTAFGTNQIASVIVVGRLDFLDTISTRPEISERVLPVLVGQCRRDARTRDVQQVDGYAGQERLALFPMAVTVEFGVNVTADTGRP